MRACRSRSSACSRPAMMDSGCTAAWLKPGLSRALWIRRASRWTGEPVGSKPTGSTPKAFYELSSPGGAATDRRARSCGCRALTMRMLGGRIANLHGCVRSGWATRRPAGGSRQPRPCLLPIIDIADRPRRREPVVVVTCLRVSENTVLAEPRRPSAQQPVFRACHISPCHIFRNILLFNGISKQVMQTQAMSWSPALPIFNSNWPPRS